MCRRRKEKAFLFSSLEKHRKALDFAELYRNKQVAHNDYDTFSELKNETGVTREQVDKTIVALGEFINDFEEQCKFAKTNWELVAKEADADRLLEILRYTNIT